MDLDTIGRGSDSRGAVEFIKLLSSLGLSLLRLLVAMLILAETEKLEFKIN